MFCYGVIESWCAVWYDDVGIVQLRHKIEKGLRPVQCWYWYCVVLVLTSMIGSRSVPMVWSKLRDLPTKVTLTERPSDWKMVARDHLCQSNVFHPPMHPQPPPTSYKRDLTGAKRHSVVEEAYQAVAVTQLLIRSSSDHLCLTNWPQWDNFQVLLTPNMLIPAKGQNPNNYVPRWILQGHGPWTSQVCVVSIW